MNARSAVIVVGAMTIAGFATGALWGVLVPGVHSVIADTHDNGRVHVYLGNQEGVFTAATMLAGMSAAVAVVSAVAVWQWSASRGPAMVGVLTIGSLAVTAAAVAAGDIVGRLRFGTVDVAGAQLDDAHRIMYALEPPPILYGHDPTEIAATFTLAPLFAVLVYAFCVIACPRDDLGVPSSTEAPGERILA